MLLILLIVMAHGLVWEFMISAARQGAQHDTQDATP